MKSITKLLMLLVLAMCGIGASAQTTVTLDGTSTSGGTFWRNGSAQTSTAWCSKWVSSSNLDFPEITITAASNKNNMQSYQSAGFRWALGSGSTSTTYTMSIADGYVISGIEIQFYNSTSSAMTMSCNGTSVTATGSSASSAATLAVSDLNRQSVSIGLSDPGTNVNCFIPVLKVTYEELQEVTFNVEVTDGTNTLSFEDFTISKGVTLTAADFLGISDEYINSTSHTVTLADEGQTITFEVSANDALPFKDNANYAWQTAVGNSPAYVNVDSATLAVQCPNNYSIDLTKPVPATHVWKFEGDVINGYSINNVYSGQYLGGRTASGGAMSMEDTPSYFAPVYAKAHEDWKCLLITYDEEGTEEGIPVVPVWKWLMEV